MRLSSISLRKFSFRPAPLHDDSPFCASAFFRPSPRNAVPPYLFPSFHRVSLLSRPPIFNGFPAITRVVVRSISPLFARVFPCPQLLLAALAVLLPLPSKFLDGQIFSETQSVSVPHAPCSFVKLFLLPSSILSMPFEPFFPSHIRSVCTFPHFSLGSRQ